MDNKDFKIDVKKIRSVKGIFFFLDLSVSFAASAVQGLIFSS